MTKLKKFLFFILPLAIIFSFAACSSDDNGGNDSQQTQTVTVTYYGDTTSTTPRTVQIESGTVLSDEFTAVNTTHPKATLFKNGLMRAARTTRARRLRAMSRCSRIL